MKTFPTELPHRACLIGIYTSWRRAPGFLDSEEATQRRQDAKKQRRKDAEQDIVGSNGIVARLLTPLLASSRLCVFALISFDGECAFPADSPSRVASCVDNNGGKPDWPFVVSLNSLVNSFQFIRAPALTSVRDQ